jgi:3-oxoadipate enol-lactonase
MQTNIWEAPVIFLTPFSQTPGNGRLHRNPERESLMPFAKLPDAQLHYEWSGTENAPVLVFSNSLGTTLRMWDAQIADFSKYFRILRYDTRGHGQSSITPGPYTIEQLGRDVLHVLDSLQLAQVSFCGLSMGGMTGMFLGSHWPARFRKIVLCNTAAKIGTPETWNTRIDVVQNAGMKAVAGAVIERWFTAPFRTGYPIPTAAMLAMLESTNPTGYVANCAAVRDFDYRDRLSAVKVPTLVLSGTHDPVSTPADGQFLSKSIPGAHFVEVPAAHMSNIEAQAEFNREVLSFLRS